MIRIGAGLLCVAATTLVLELTLVRVFDVIWYSNMAYMVITLAMFCFGLSGVYSSLRPLGKTTDINQYLAVLSFLFAAFSLLILPAMNLLPLDFNRLYSDPAKSVVFFLLMYLALSIPFFLAGLMFTALFSHYADKIQRLYCWDLTGAAIGCLILIPFLPPIGPGGILFLSAGLGLVASGLFSPGRRYSIFAYFLASVVTVIPFVHDGYFEFKPHVDKRGIKIAAERENVQDSRWDPISKIDVIDHGRMKHIAYDGGSQSSYIIQFNGDYKRLRENVEKKRGLFFYGSFVYASHAFKRDTNQDVLVIGAAGGSEIKAALIFGARHVDAVELVGYVVELGKKKYAEFNGGIFNHPDVNAMRGEGRSFLRSTDKKYDIIQIFSNHTSSSIAAGTGAMATTYLQTAEAYEEYLTHLKDDGILHINHHVYPRMITTAALAWKNLGLDDFSSHVLVIEGVKEGLQDNLPTLMIKMTPWTEPEVKELMSYFSGAFKLVVNPLDPVQNMLSEDFFSGELPRAISDKVAYRVEALTDDRPYFNFLRKTNKTLVADPAHFLNYSTASLLNSQLKNGWIPSDVIHLLVTGGASLVFIVVFIGVPMLFSRTGRERWPGKLSSLLYFSCLGAGFIIFELVFIQIFMKLIGYPLYTYSTVVFSMLLAAGLGSTLSSWLGISPRKKWFVPFAGILVCSVVLICLQKQYFELFLQSPDIVRMLAAFALIFPLGLFLGMAFPLGILTVADKPNGSVAWAWAMNGLFTVIGGLASVVLSIYYGFIVTLIVAVMMYVLAFFAYIRLRATVA